MTVSQFEDALAFVKKVDSLGAGGDSVYEHLVKVVTKILDEEPKGAVDLLETSILVNKTNKGVDTPAAKKQNVVPAKSIVGAAKTVQQCKLFLPPGAPIDPSTGEPQEVDPPNEYECEDVLQDSALLEAVGAGLSRNEMYFVGLAVKRLGEDPQHQVEYVRFFGKMFGTSQDYYVFQCTLKEYPEEEATEGQDEIPMEQRSGSNQYVYFVCNDIGGQFVKLPDVTPQQIKQARKLKRYLTGDLKSRVSTYPPFNGNEANYLRSQIARIAATTQLCPANMFIAGEEGEIEKNEEFEALQSREMASTANWCHRLKHLKKQGRCDLHVREAPEDEEEEFQLTEEEQEEGPEQLATCENDAEVEGGPAWTSVYSSTNENVKFQVAGIRSNLWPGAYSIAQGAKFVNIYVGWGAKNERYVPPPPPPIGVEYDQKLVESTDLPPKPQPEAEGEEQDE